MDIKDIIFVVVLIASIVLHEIAHGYTADRLGDPTARLAGRLSLNPLVHIDWIGSVLLPLFLIITGSPFLLGWAKPVPFNPRNIKNPETGSMLVALAGPLTNIAIALVASLALHAGVFQGEGIFFTTLVIMTNISLAVFNLVPIPPLDGHHILFALIPSRFHYIKSFFQKYSFIFLVIFVMYGWKFISPIIIKLSEILI